MVYVINIHNDPLMPCKEAKARKLLKAGKAKIVKRNPFTIQLLFECENITQPITLGVDAGSKYVGLSATTSDKELYAAELELRNDIVSLLAARREARRTRRNRKTRYRKPRFNNRKVEKGWLAPSVKNKIESHLTIIRKIHELLPISKIVVEVASFDIQKIKNPDISGDEYQKGEQFGFWNVREYVLFRDSHTCQCCKGKSKDPILNVHHIESRKTGGNAPNNLITLCETCHKGYHKGIVKLPRTIRRGMSFRDATFMGIMKWAFYERLKELYSDVSLTYGYITKTVRIKNELPKTHYIDARCISGHPAAKPLGYYFRLKKVRCHNRQIYKMKILKGGVKKRNQASYLVRGFRLFDKVIYNGQECFVFGRRSTGYFDLRKLDGTSVAKNASYKKIQFLETRKTILCEIVT